MTDARSAPDTESDTLGIDPASEVQIPEGAETYACDHCGRVFARERYRDLHRGREHPAAVDESEADAYRAAAQSEWDDLRRYRYVALGTLVVLYFGFLLAYAFVGT